MIAEEKHLIINDRTNSLRTRRFCQQFELSRPMGTFPAKSTTARLANSSRSIQSSNDRHSERIDTFFVFTRFNKLFTTNVAKKRCGLFNLKNITLSMEANE